MIFRVEAKDSSLIISTDSVNLYQYADSRTDERVQKCNRKSIQLIEATVQRDKSKIKQLFGDSPMNMEDYVQQYLNMHKEVLLASLKPTKYEVANTFYIDEISNHGHKVNGWRWTTYCRVYWPNEQTRIVRYNWQPKTNYIDEWELDKPLPFKQMMTFRARPPFRSRIKVYDPKGSITRLLRNINKLIEA